MEIYDVAILGAGPEESAQPFMRQERSFTQSGWTKNAQGGQIIDTYEVDNYPGMPGINGMDLGEAFGAHAAKLGLMPKRRRFVRGGRTGS